MKSLKFALPVLLLSVCLGLTLSDRREQCGWEQCGCGTVSNCPASDCQAGQPTAVCTQLAETAPSAVFGEPTPAPPRTAPLVAQTRVVHHPRGQVIYVEVESSALELTAEIP